MTRHKKNAPLLMEYTCKDSKIDVIKDTHQECLKVEKDTLSRKDTNLKKGQKQENEEGKREAGQKGGSMMHPDRVTGTQKLTCCS